MTLLIFGATGSAGGSVLRVCLDSPRVTAVRVIVRKAPTLRHGKLSVVTHDDYADYARVADAFADVDACLYCLGKSVQQVSGEPVYRRITYDYAVAAAMALAARS